MNFILNCKVRRISRWLAWLLLLLMLSLFISGYAMTGRLPLSVQIARTVHKSMIPIAIILFAFHSIYGSRILLSQRKIKKKP